MRVWFIDWCVQVETNPLEQLTYKYIFFSQANTKWQQKGEKLFKNFKKTIYLFVENQNRIFRLEKKIISDFASRYKHIFFFPRAGCEQSRKQNAHSMSLINFINSSISSQCTRTIDKHENKRKTSTRDDLVAPTQLHTTHHTTTK